MYSTPRTLLLILFAMVLLPVFGQSERELQGRIVSDEAEITFVTIQNLRTERATITDLDGYFAIRAAVGDSLVFSAVQLKPQEIVVTPGLYESTFFQVSMELRVTELEGVTLMPYDLSGNLGSDAEALGVSPVTAESLGLPNAGIPIPTQSERRLLEANSGPLLYFPGVNFNKLLNALSGRTKELKARVKMEREDRILEGLRESLSDSIYLKQLRIPQDRLSGFMYFCAADPEYPKQVAANDQLKLWEFFVRKSEEYRESNGLE